MSLDLDKGLADPRIRLGVARKILKRRRELGELCVVLSRSSGRCNQQRLSGSRVYDLRERNLCRR